jgi:hypothetical protein
MKLLQDSTVSNPQGAPSASFPFPSHADPWEHYSEKNPGLPPQSPLEGPHRPFSLLPLLPSACLGLPSPQPPLSFFIILRNKDMGHFDLRDLLLIQTKQKV